MSHFGPPDSIRRRVGRPPFGTLGPRLLRKRALRSRFFAHETLLPGSRIALRTTDHAETQKLVISRPRSGDPLTVSRFGPPDSVRRRVGRPLFEGGDLTPGFSEPAQPRGAGSALLPGLSGLSHGGRESTMQGGFYPLCLAPSRGQGGPLSESALLPGLSGLSTGAGRAGSWRPCTSAGGPSSPRRRGNGFGQPRPKQAFREGPRRPKTLGFRVIIYTQ